MNLEDKAYNNHMNQLRDMSTAATAMNHQLADEKRSNEADKKRNDQATDMAELAWTNSTALHKTSTLAAGTTAKSFGA